MLRLLAVCLSMAVLSACSLSASSKSSSTSSESVSDLASSPSSLSLSSKDQAKKGFEKDVVDYTAEFVKSPKGDTDSFRARLGKIAEKYGVTQWEADRTTYVAIGKGLRKAGLGQPQYEAFKASLGDSQAWKMDAIAEGYASK